MALFFDKTWFDAKLAAFGLTRAQMAVIGGVSGDDLTLMFKDQMEVGPTQISAWAALFSQSDSEIANRCGISTLVRKRADDTLRIERLEARLEHLERQVAGLLKQQDAQS